MNKSEKESIVDKTCQDIADGLKREGFVILDTGEVKKVIKVRNYYKKKYEQTPSGKKEIGRALIREMQNAKRDARGKIMRDKSGKIIQKKRRH